MNQKCHSRSISAVLQVSWIFGTLQPPKHAEWDFWALSTSCPLQSFLFLDCASVKVDNCASLNFLCDGELFFFLSKY